MSNPLKRIFRQYEREPGGKGNSDWHKKNLAVEEADAYRQAERANAADERKDKRQVRSTRTKSGFAGVLATRDHGSVEEKLRKQIGGKATRRLLNNERRAGRERPDELVITVKDEEGNAVTLTRGVDYAVLPRPIGEPTLVLHDRAKDFEATYSDEFAAWLDR